MNPPDERRFELRKAANRRGVVVAPGLEMGCVIIDASPGGLRVRVDRGLALPSSVIVVDVAQGTACQADVAWSKGQDAGFKCQAQTSLRGLVPARLTPARDAWLRAGRGDA